MKRTLIRLGFHGKRHRAKTLSDREYMSKVMGIGA